MEPWRDYRSAVVDLYHIDEDPDPHQSAYSDSDPHQCANSDSDPHQSERRSRIRI
jgi:hypothetical protein